MKKTVLWMFALLLCLAVGTASAAIEQVGQEVCYSYGYSESYPTIYFYAEVTNTGSSAADLDSDSSIAIYDESGEELDSSSLDMIPMVLQPGETGYVFGSIYTDLPDSSSIKSYKFNIVEGEPYWEVTTYEGEAVKAENDVYVRLTNNGTETLWDSYAYIVVKDAAGRPIYINDTIAYQIGIPSGQCLDFPMFFTSGLQQFLTENGMAPAEYVVGGYTYE